MKDPYTTKRKKKPVKPENRGGARQGAGRPSCKLLPLTMRVSQAEKDMILNLRKQEFKKAGG